LSEFEDFMAQGKLGSPGPLDQEAGLVAQMALDEAQRFPNQRALAAGGPSGRDHCFPPSARIRRIRLQHPVHDLPVELAPRWVEILGPRNAALFSHHSSIGRVRPAAFRACYRWTGRNLTLGAALTTSQFNLPCRRRARMDKTIKAKAAMTPTTIETTAPLCMAEAYHATGAAS
jgi:hypothetical protein